MRRRLWLLCLLALSVLWGCSGGGGGSSSGTTAAPAPGPVRVRATMEVEVPPVAREEIKARSNIFQVLVEVVDPFRADTATKSGKVLVTHAAADVPDDSSSQSQGSTSSPSANQVVNIAFDVTPGVWEVHVFGIDQNGKVVGFTPPFIVTFSQGSTFFQRVLLQSTNPLSPLSITVTPTPATVQAGAQQQFSAIIRLADGSTVNGPVQWSSSNPSALSIDPNTGIATAHSAATGVIITATSTQNPLVKGTATVDVTGAGLVSTALTASSTTPRVGDAITLTNTGTLSTGGTTDVTSQSTFSQNPAGVLDLSTAATNGTARALRPGTTVVTAVVNGLTSQLSITVAKEKLVVLRSNFPANAIVESFLIDESSPIPTFTLVSNPATSGASNHLETTPDGRSVFVSHQGTGMVDRFAMDLAGALPAVPSNILPGLNQPGEIAADNAVLYIRNGNGVANDGVLPVRTGDLVAVGPELDTGLNQIQSLAVNAAGLTPRALAGVTGFAVNRIFALVLNASGVPTGHLPPNSPVDPAPNVGIAVRFHPTLNVLYVAGTTPAGPVVAAVDVTLQTFSFFPVNPAGGTAHALAITPDGQTLYVLSRSGGVPPFTDIITVFPLGANGIPTNAGTPVTLNNTHPNFGADPEVDPDGDFLFVVRNAATPGGADIEARRIGAGGSIGAAADATLTRPGAFEIEVTP